MKKKIVLSAILTIVCAVYAIWARLRTMGLGIYTLDTTVGKFLINSWRPAAVLAVVSLIALIAFIGAGRKMPREQKKVQVGNAGFCSKCGAQMGEGQKFCVNCGQKAGEEAVK